MCKHIHLLRTCTFNPHITQKLANLFLMHDLFTLVCGYQSTSSSRFSSPPSPLSMVHIATQRIAEWVHITVDTRLAITMNCVNYCILLLCVKEHLVDAHNNMTFNYQKYKVLSGSFEMMTLCSVCVF